MDSFSDCRLYHRFFLSIFHFCSFLLFLLPLYILTKQLLETKNQKYLCRFVYFMCLELLLFFLEIYAVISGLIITTSVGFFSVSFIYLISLKKLILPKVHELILKLLISTGILLLIVFNIEILVFILFIIVSLGILLAISKFSFRFKKKLTKQEDPQDRSDLILKFIFVIVVLIGLMIYFIIQFVYLTTGIKLITFS